MPSGLDGNPNPVVTPERDALLAELVAAIPGTHSRILVGVDGRSGAGKSTLADELATRLQARRTTTVRSTTDSFHRPREQRYRRGRLSPEGYYLDSHDLDAIRQQLLDPFRRGADRVRTALFDEPTDSPVDEFADRLPDRAVLIFDGLFLCRPELRSYWDVCIYLDAGRRRSSRWLEYLLDNLPEGDIERDNELTRRLFHAGWSRYGAGWQLYLDEADPTRAADLVIDNSELAKPTIQPQAQGAGNGQTRPPGRDVENPRTAPSPW